MIRRRYLRFALQTLTLTRRRLSSAAAVTVAAADAAAKPSAATAAAANVSVENITLSNFESSLQDIRRRIRDADFVAVDLEMTGVTSTPWRDSFEFDSSEVRYLKVKDSAEKFAVLQFGVCTFRWDSAKGSFVAHPHNFYIFPRKEIPVDGISYEFLCQTSSIDFLARHQFDFNACIREGISYLSRAQEVEVRRKLFSACEDGLSNSSDGLEDCVRIPIVSTADLLFTERMKNRFQEWRDGIVRSPDEGSTLGGSHGASHMQLQTVLFKMRPAVVLNGFSSNQLKLVKLVLKKHFKDLVYIHDADDDMSMENKVVYTGSENDKASFMKEIRGDQLRRTEARVKLALGFRQIIDILASEKKLIVGHNCFLDMAHIHSKFFGPLPSSMMDFAGSLHAQFPHIIDTKRLLFASTAIQILMKKSSRALSSAFSLLCPNISSTGTGSGVRVEVQADETRSSCWSSGTKHEAGYDAFMTGCIFAQACSHLGIKFEADSVMTDFTGNEKLQCYINRLYPSWKSGTILDLSTGTESLDSSYVRKNPAVVFENVVLVCGFPSKVKLKDLKANICKVLSSASVTAVFFLDATAVLVQFSKEEYVKDFLVLMDTLELDNGPVSVLHPLADLLEGGKTRVARYDAYKEICSSSASRVLFADQAETVDIEWGAKSHSEGNTELSGNQKITVDTKPMMHSHHEVSCDDILDSLSASKSLFQKRKRSAYG